MQPAGIVLFLPARNEETTVGRVIARVPDRICGLPVHCLVIDDGSTDATAAQAEAEGATVIRHPFNIGIGGGALMGAGAGFGLRLLLEFRAHITYDARHAGRRRARAWPS